MSTLVIRYAGFAIVATLINLAAQRGVFWINAAWFFPAMIAGTGSGLIAKYLLDKRWIFYDAARPAGEEGRKFLLYTFTGIGTTLLFWGSETAFWLVWKTDAMRETGAVMGLSIGYLVKYNLDRRFVFSNVPGPR
ncbi:GtrA-like protein [Thalassovita gelatinovora]|uniref:GtrA-like protein n=1 Tax=Thalassovita gelatinovora TaxID=53501 RepID=A0A0P1F853_THAGE|nr:GtrA family protein [Thalassovita gelatinovora]CUH64147.1 GtrA-like protein [Thalassovita gelatinovora]SEQ84390.1 GtrA-like protein [Thalassovita gelatinovora]